MKQSLTIHAYSKGKKKLTFAQKTADIFTKGVGSWGFIFIFLTFLITWVTINIVITKNYSKEIVHDPYPFILLNLILSSLAAIQAPFVLMSQNRAAERDRVRAEYDYYVNRKAEREIQRIKEQLDNIEKKLLK